MAELSKCSTTPRQYVTTFTAALLAPFDNSYRCGRGKVVQFSPKVVYMAMRHWICRPLTMSTLALILLAAGFAVSAQTTDPSWVARAAGALDVEIQRVRQGLVVYEDVDSGYNHGTFSGFFGSPSAIPKLSIDTGCVPVGNPPTGCSTDPNTIDKDHRTVIRFTFQPLTGNEFVGVSCVEPAGLFVGQNGSPYDLRGVNQISFDAASPDASNGMKVQFGFGGSTGAFQTLSPQWTHITITLAQQSAFTDLQHTAILFTIVTNAANAPGGGTVLVDNIRFDPTPTQQTQTLGFPVGYRTYGVVPVRADLSGPIPIPPDQLFRNQAQVDQMAWTASILTAVNGYNVSARTVLDTFVSEAANPNLALAPPATMDQLQARGLLSCFSSGDAGLKNDSGGALAGSGRPCGFSVGTNYRVVLDGATGGQNATIILSLLRGYLAFKDVRYLSTALALADWIQEKLADSSTADYGGYYYGYLYVTQVGAKVFVKSKTTVDNALIFSAFSALSDVEASAGKSDAPTWKSRAAAAAQFVGFMYRPDGRFYSGTVPDSQPTDLGQGIRADGPKRGGETINSYDVIGNYTIVPLALSAQPAVLAQFNLATLMRPLLKLATTVTVGSLQLSGFSSAESDVPPGGVDWILTGSAALVLRLAAADSTSTPDIQAAAQQYLSQFDSVEQSLAVASVIPGATLNNEIGVRPYAQCLVSPFGCQPARPSIGATVLALATAKLINPFALTGINSTPPPPIPAVTAVVNAASFLSGSISPGEIVTVFGTNFGPASLAGASLDSSGKVAASSGGVQVLIGGTAAPMIYAISGQVSAVVPYEVAGSSNTTVQVTYAGQLSNSLPVGVTSTVPGMFTLSGSGTGPGAILNADNSLNSAANPANKGGVVVLYVTGEGQTNPQGVTGKVNNVSRVQDLPVPAQPVTASVDGQTATVLFAAEAPGFVSGVMQVNVQIPATASSGNVPVVVSVGGNGSQTVVTVAVR